MKLFILKPRDGLGDGDNPWDPWYDKCFGVVVRAKSHAAARVVAEEHHSGESCPVRGIRGAWAKAKYSTCVELKAYGSEGLIIQDISNA